MYREVATALLVLSFSNTGFAEAQGNINAQTKDECYFEQCPLDPPTVLSCMISDNDKFLGEHTLTLDSSHNDLEQRIRYMVSFVSRGDGHQRTLSIYFRRNEEIWIYDEEGSSGFTSEPGFDCDGSRPLTSAKHNW